MNKSFIEDYMVQISEQQNSTLTRTLHDVNIRLYKNNKRYRGIVENTIDMMSDILHMSFANYPSVQGISGANIGVPFNIILIRFGDADETMINPKIISRIGADIEVKSNCGSIVLDKPIEALRTQTIEVEYYDLFGVKKVERFSREDKGFTIQHEIDHNLGITILDRNEEYKNKGDI